MQGALYWLMAIRGDDDRQRNGGRRLDEPPVRGHKDLIAWQVAMELCFEVYRVTKCFPAEERYGLASELRKTARSVVCNIAEGHQRATTREFLRFLDISRGSRAELETQLMLATELGYIDSRSSRSLLDLTHRTGRLATGLNRALQRKLTNDESQGPTADA